MFTQELNKTEWRKKLKAGDLVMMKTGGMAILTEGFFRFPAWRVEELVNASR